MNDGSLFARAAAHPITSTTGMVPFVEAVEAPARLRSGRLIGAAMLDCR